jgi:hypothetical protein
VTMSASPATVTIEYPGWRRTCTASVPPFMACSPPFAGLGWACSARACRAAYPAAARVLGNVRMTGHLQCAVKDRESGRRGSPSGGSPAVCRRSRLDGVLCLLSRTAGRCPVLLLVWWAAARSGAGRGGPVAGQGMRRGGALSAMLRPGGH